MEGSLRGMEEGGGGTWACVVTIFLFVLFFVVSEEVCHSNFQFQFCHHFVTQHVVEILSMTLPVRKSFCNIVGLFK